MTGLYRQRAEVVTRRVAGETLLVPVRGELADLRNLYALNEAGAFIWQRLDGRHALPDIQQAMVASLKVEPEQAGADLEEFVTGLRAAGLIVEVS
jgi:hypothetical protein